PCPCPCPCLAFFRLVRGSSLALLALLAVSAHARELSSPATALPRRSGRSSATTPRRAAPAALARGRARAHARRMSDALDFRGAALALLENALDELAEGHAREVELELGPETIRVRDDGRGLPVHAHPQSGRPLLEVILTGPRRGPRNTLARLNAGCLWLEVLVERDGGRWRQRYELALP